MSMHDGKERDLHDLNLQTFTASALFARTFEEGMSLVEETAHYLDGLGREEARVLPRKAALLYAGESMRVTTRLMQAASWLLVQRAVQEGEMRSDEAGSERYRLGSKDICLGGKGEAVESLPNKLQDLLHRSDNLYRRIDRLDQVLYQQHKQAPAVRAHFERLEQVFGCDDGGAGDESAEREPQPFT